jgi:tryptophan-rich sensory protein
LTLTLRTVAATSAAAAANAVVGGLARSDRRWYRRLRKPAFQPPPTIFPIVWTALYANLAVTSAATIDGLRAAGRDEEASHYSTALGANLVLNAGWTWLFFRAHQPLLATAECAVLAVSSADLIRRSSTLDRRLGLALAPYAAWTTFAAVLSGAISRLNRRR